jgi:uncharacterized protein YndB with AHSA1/START domain
MRIQARGELLAPIEDVWAILAEPYHLPDWWPGYQGVEPDRRGLAPGARWAVARGTIKAATGLRRPGARGTLVVRDVVERATLGWHDVEQRMDVTVVIEPADQGRTGVGVSLDAPAWRLVLEGLQGVPRQAVRRLYDLCQTAADR